MDYLVKRDLVVLGMESKMAKGEKLLLKELDADMPTGTLLEVVRGVRPVPADWSSGFTRVSRTRVRQQQRESARYRQVPVDRFDQAPAGS